MAFADLTANLRLNIAGFTRAMNNARRQAQRFSSQLASVTKEGSADKLIEGYTRLNDRLHKVGLGARDVARIVAGMTISQTFYGITRSIREATSALWEFNENLDYANVTYGALFGDSNLASDFIDTLKQYSIDTIFEYSDIEGMARKLSAYGIEYKNLMYIIEGLTNIGTISGDTAALERLAVAIGQINAKGTLKAEEMRQLANAYTPIYDILRDKLGLTEEELGRVGDLGISSAEAINAIIEYANETFGATADAAVLTIRGLNNKIVDSLKVMGADIMSPVTTFYKSLANYIANSLNEIYEIYQTSGLGGVFEHLVPSEEWQNRIRSLIATLKNTISTMIAHFTTMWPYIKQFLGGIIDAFTLFLGVLNVASSALVGLLRTISANSNVLHVLTSALVAAAGGWLLFKIHAMGAAAISVLKVIIVDVAKAVLFLTTVLTKHPIIAGLTVLGAVLLGVASNAKNTNSAISNLINSFNSISIGGKTADDVLQVEDAMNSGTDAADKFWNEMEDGAKDTEDAIDGAGNAAKKASKSLLSFDEVFKLNDDEGAGSGLGSGVLDGIGDLSDALGGLGSALIPEIPDLSSYANDFVNTLYNSLWESIKTIASGGAMGALIGGLVGFTIGGLVTKTMAGALTGAKYGAKIGTVVGAAFAGFWTDTYKEMEKSLIKIAVASSGGALAGGLIGMIIGAFATKTLDGALTGAKYGAAIGGLAGAGIGAFWAGATEELSNAIEGLMIGGATGALVGGLVGLLFGAFSTKTLKGALTGAKHGAAIGSLVGGALGGVFGSFERELQNKITSIVWGGAEGALVGGLAGMILGAFATKTLAGALTGAKYGAIIGGMLGGTFDAIFGDAETDISKRLGNMFASVSAASNGALFGGLAGMIIGAIVGVFAGGTVIPMAKAGATLGAAIGALGAMLIEYLNNSGITEALGEFFSNLWNNVTEWFVETTAGIAAWIAETVLGFKNMATAVIASFASWFVETKNGIKNWIVETALSIANWFVETKNGFTNWVKNTALTFANWFVETKNGIATWISDTLTRLKEWPRDAASFIATFAIETITKFTAWKNDTISTFKTWISDTLSRFRNWFSETTSSMVNWVNNTKASVKNWWSSIWDASNWRRGWDIISSWFSNLFRDIGNWFVNIGNKISEWWDSIWSDKEVSIGDVNSLQGVSGYAKLSGHAKGGIFNREHIARFAEGNKAEAVIPLEDNTAMQPFVSAISDGILQGLLPVMAVNNGGASSLPPMYVGTLIADERGLQQLYKKFELYEAKELARKGLA